MVRLLCLCAVSIQPRDVQDSSVYFTIGNNALSTFLLPGQDDVRTSLEDAEEEIEIPAYSIPA